MSRPSLVVQWLRICIEMQGTRVRSLVREDSTCHRATKPVSHTTGPALCGVRKLRPLSPRVTTAEACALEPELCNEKPLQREALTLQQESSPCSSQLQRARVQQ